jgi:hypothetical protein
MRKVLIALLSLTLAGFGPVVVKSATAEDEAQAKTFAPDPARALVYVYRNKSMVGGSLTSQFVVDHKVVAETKKGSFNVISFKPGVYALLSISSREGSAGASLIHNKSKPPVELNAEAGQIYYFQEVFKPMGGFSLKGSSVEEAQAAIRKSKLLAVHTL